MLVTVSQVCCPESFSSQSVYCHVFLLYYHLDIIYLSADTIFYYFLFTEVTLSSFMISPFLFLPPKMKFWSKVFEIFAQFWNTGHLLLSLRACTHKVYLATKHKNRNTSSCKWDFQIACIYFKLFFVNVQTCYHITQYKHTLRYKISIKCPIVLLENILKIITHTHTHIDT